MIMGQVSIFGAANIVLVGFDNQSLIKVSVGVSRSLAHVERSIHVC